MYGVSFNLGELILRAFREANLDARSQKILERRYGLTSGESATLQELGDLYAITRERVRQLECQAFKETEKAFASLAEANELRAFMDDYLRRVGGIRRHDLLANELYALFRPSRKEGVFTRELRFVLAALGEPFFSKEDETYHDFWYRTEETRRVLVTLHDELIRRLKRIEHFEEVLRTAMRPHEGLSDTAALSYLAVSKKIGVGPYGDLGLSHWEEVAPKTVRAKSYLLLKKLGRPLHFSEIAERIESHPPTVHNELIKDARFTLVGRGTYGLTA